MPIILLIIFLCTIASAIPVPDDQKLAYYPPGILEAILLSCAYRKFAKEDPEDYGNIVDLCTAELFVDRYSLKKYPEADEYFQSFFLKAIEDAYWVNYIDHL